MSSTGILLAVLTWWNRMEDNEFKLLSYEELMSLTKSEFQAYYQKVKEYFRDRQTEIAPGYARMTYDQKIEYWSALGRQMRWQAESGLDPYIFYSAEWRENILRFEPDFDLIMEEVFHKNLQWEWDYDEYLRRVHASSEQTKFTLPKQTDDYL